MFVEWDSWPPAPREPPEPGPQGPKVTKRDEALFLWLAVVGLLAWFLAPFAGGSLIQAAAFLVRG